HGVAVRDVADRIVRTRDDLIAGLEPLQHLEVFIARYAHFDRKKLDGLVLALTNDEHAFGFLPGLTWLQFFRRRDRVDHTVAAAAAAAAFLLVLGLTHDLAVRVVRQLAHGD